MRSIEDIITKIKIAEKEMHSFAKGLQSLDAAPTSSLSLIGLYKHLEENLSQEEVDIGVRKLALDGHLNLSNDVNGARILEFTNKFFED